jgi:drug/metabolite transporter (DMT)-like permease
MNSRAYVQLLILGALWGAAFMLMRIAVPEFGAIATAGARITLACAMMVLCVVVMKQSMRLRTHWKKYLLVGGINTAIPFLAYCFAALYIPSAYSAIANSTTPIWSALIAWLWFKQDLSWSKWVGIVFAFVGVIALVGLQPVTPTPMVIAAVIAALVGAMMYATASFLIKRYLTDAGGLAGSTGMVWGAFMWLIIPAIVAAPTQMPSLKAWVAIAALALFCTVIGYVLFFHLIDRIGPQRASSAAFLFPAFAALWGWLLIDEPVTLNMLIGMALVLFGTALVSKGDSNDSTPSLWARLRDTLFLPIALAVAPMRLRRRLAAWIGQHPGIYRREMESARHGYLASGLTQPVDDVIAHLRLTRVVDFADMWLSLLRSDRWVKRVVQTIDAERIRGEPSLILIFHYGGGWWMSRYFRLLGERISIVMFRGKPGASLADRFLHKWGDIRLKWIEKICGAPLIVTDDGGAGQKVKAAWDSGAHVYIASDMPPILVRESVPVPFFGRDGYFPIRPLRLAAANNIPVYALISGWHPSNLTPTLEFRRLQGDTPEARLAHLVAMHEARIRAHPGAWHLWGEWPLFFDPPKAAK